MDVRHYTELIGFFSRFLNDKDAAADVVQESYVRVFALTQSENVVRDLRALLYKTGKNIAIDAARRRKIEASAYETLAVLGATQVMSVEGQVNARLQLERLLQRVQAMPRKRQEVFVLVRVFGFTHAEAAQHLALSIASIEKHIVRAVYDLYDLRSRYLHDKT